MLAKTLLATALISAVSAHQNWQQLWINDVTPGPYEGIRMPTSNSPVTDVTSDDMACNVLPANAATVEPTAANEGDTIKVKWDSSSHPGPITHFLYGPVEDATKATGVGAGWFKIDELDAVDGKWANEIMLADNMTHTFKLPTGLASGDYLLRSEMLALHGSQTVGGGQFYIGCAPLTITGTGSKGACGPTISIPGTYKAEDSDIYIPNFYNGFDLSTYTAPGGPVATCGGANSTTPVASTSAASNSTMPSTTAAPVVSSAAASVAVETPEASAIETPVAEITSAPFGNVTSILPTLLPSTFATLVKPSAQSAAPTGGSSSGTVAQVYQQCGGKNWTGATTCASGTNCVKQNEFYSQCLNM